MAKKNVYDDIEKSLDIQAFVDSVKEGFSSVEDPRVSDNQTYPLVTLTIMILSASIAGANSISEIHQYSERKIEMFRRLLGITKAPCYKCFWWVLTLMKPEPFQKAFFQWVNSVSKEICERLIAIDGKHLRGLLGDLQIHLVSAWECNQGLLLGQVKANEKSNEITAIPELLDIIDVQGAMVTIDAAGCQTEIAQKIRDGRGDYMLALKGNQGTLHAEAENYFSQARAADFEEDTKCLVTTTCEKGHGRIEEREIVVVTNLDWLDSEQRARWKDLASMIEITSKREESIERRYYISSKILTPQMAGKVIRGHWSIENHLHWSLDVVFKDDMSLANTKHAGENLAFFRRMSQALIKEDVGGTVGIARRRRDAMWDDTFALRILGRLFKKKC